MEINMKNRFISCIMNIAAHQPRRKYTKKEQTKTVALVLWHDPVNAGAPAC